MRIDQRGNLTEQRTTTTTVPGIANMYDLSIGRGSSISSSSSSSSSRHTRLRTPPERTHTHIERRGIMKQKYIEKI
ncbi:unnamed protein product [Trichobilharzia regenti]|nr:unnamed protein product [Trichobilharzia regenti]